MIFGANKSKNIKDIVEQLYGGANSICNESVASNISNIAEAQNLSESIKTAMINSFSNELPENLQTIVNEDAEQAAQIFMNSMREGYGVGGKTAMNESATPTVNMLTTSIATTMRAPYEATYHRLFDTRVVSSPVVTIEEVVPTVIDPNGNEQAIIDAFNPKKTENLLVDAAEIELTKLSAGIVPGTANVNLLESLDPIYKVDRSVRLMKIEAEETGDSGKVAIAADKIKLKKGSVPYFDEKDNVLSALFEITLKDGSVIDADVTAKINYSRGTMEYVRADEHITKVFFHGTVSHEEHTHPISTSFKNSFKSYPVPTRPHIEVSVPEEVKTDIANSNSALSTVDIITSMTEQVSVISARMEDQRLGKLIKAGDNMFEAQFDFEPDTNFVHGNLEWMRREFIPFLDQCAVAMKAEYNIEDCHFRVAVSPYILKVLDTDYTKDKGLSEEQGGSGVLNYSIGVKTSTSVFYLVSSLATSDNKLHMLLIPNNFKESEVKTYCYFKYSSFLTDKLRKSSNSRMPATVYSERNLPMVFTPLSTGITVTNMPITKTSGKCFIKKK